MGVGGVTQNSRRSSSSSSHHSHSPPPNPLHCLDFWKEAVCLDDDRPNIKTIVDKTKQTADLVFLQQITIPENEVLSTAANLRQQKIPKGNELLQEYRV